MAPRSAAGIAHSRAGLLGNPSDQYGGKTIAFSIRNFRARVSIEGSDRFLLRHGPSDMVEFASFLEKSRQDDKEFTNQTITNRLFLSMLMEAILVLEESIVREPAHVDMGLLLGIGFPPFRGGLLKWCDNQGAGKVLDKTEKLIELGKRFEPPAMLRDMAKSGDKFYPVPQEILDKLKQS